jgi:hypothetical protein
MHIIIHTNTNILIRRRHSSSVEPEAFPARVNVSASDSPHARHADSDAREAESKRSWSNVQVPTKQPQV